MDVILNVAYKIGLLKLIGKRFKWLVQMQRGIIIKNAEIIYPIRKLIGNDYENNNC